jgi:hypothetical protein
MRVGYINCLSGLFTPATRPSGQCHEETLHSNHPHAAS